MVHVHWPSVCFARLCRHRLLIFRDQGVVSGERHVEISNWFGPCESTFYKASWSDWITWWHRYVAVKYFGSHLLQGRNMQS